MKTFCMVLIALSSTSAFAADVYTQFTGKFSVDKGNCNSLFFRDAKRVYISLKKSFDGVNTIQIQGYGDDAAMDEVLLGKGSRQEPGTDPRVHGKVTQSWKTTVDGNLLTSKVTVVRPSMSYRRDSTITLRNNNKSVVLRTHDQAEGDAYTDDSEVCRFVRI